jgi:hypothetical protein
MAFNHHLVQAADPEGAARATKDLVAAAATMTAGEALAALQCITGQLGRACEIHPNPALTMTVTAASVLGERLQTLAETPLDHQGCDAFLTTLNRLGVALVVESPKHD